LIKVALHILGDKGYEVESVSVGKYRWSENEKPFDTSQDIHPGRFGIVVCTKDKRKVFENVMISEESFAINISYDGSSINLEIEDGIEEVYL